VASIPSTPKANSHEDLLTTIKELENISRRLKHEGQLLAYLSVANFLLSVLFNAFLLRWSYAASTLSELLLILSALATLVALMLAVKFESKRKLGDVLFKEASDDLQWRSRFGDATASLGDRPDIGARIALRSFAETTDVPLVPGRFGPLIYLLFNLTGLVFYGLTGFR
jgi:hypothetical protein